MRLNFQDRGSGPPLIIMHGLFGSLSNWKSIARRLEDDHRVVIVDLRNHGRSGWSDDVSYPAMADDIAELMDRLGLERSSLVGHSMGGKVAMSMALTQPGRVDRLVVVDIAPVEYGHSHEGLVETMLGVDLDRIHSRQDLDAQLEHSIPEPGVRSFLGQNLEFADGRYRWRINLEALANAMGLLTGFPGFGDQHFDGPTCFVYGQNSDYVGADHRAAIKRYFPNATLIGIPAAGHWVHAEKPDAVIDAIRSLTVEA